MPLVQGRKRRAQPEPEASPEASPEPPTQRRRLTPDSENEAYDSDHGAATQAGGSLDQLVKKMVRLALACEYQRRPIRRADISEKVLGSAGRQFKTVFNQAQLQLRSVFGMEMMELPSKEKVTVQQRRAAQKNTQQGKTPAAAWVLVSILPPQLRTPDILDPPAVPTAAEESKYIAIYTLLVSLITLAGGALPDAKMERYLRRLQMEDNTPIDGFEKTEKLLKRLEKDGYVFKVKETTGAGDEDVYWCIGPRGRVEIGDDGTRGLVRSVYGELDEDGDEDLERRIARSLGVGERVERKEALTSAGEKKKRGRRRREEEEEEEGEEEEEEAEEDDAED